MRQLAVCFRIAGGIAVVGAAWFIWHKYLQSAIEPTPERAAFAEGQRMTRGELFMTIACLVVTALFTSWSVDLIVNRGNAVLAHREGLLFYFIPAPFLIFGFASIVATHGKWKLTLAALGCFAASVVLWWTWLMCMLE